MHAGTHATSDGKKERSDAKSGFPQDRKYRERSRVKIKRTAEMRVATAARACYDDYVLTTPVFPLSHTHVLALIGTSAPWQ